MFELAPAKRPQLDLFDVTRESQEEMKKAILASQHESVEASYRTTFFPSSRIGDVKPLEESAKMQVEEGLRRSMSTGAAPLEFTTEFDEVDRINCSSAAATPKDGLPRMTNLAAEMIENHDFFAEH